MKRFPAWRHLPLLLGCLALGACATEAPGQAYFVKPAPFPVPAKATPDAIHGSVFPVDTTGSLYGNQRSWQVGDVVTINVTLNASAQDNNAGSLTKSSSLNAAVNTFLGIPPTFGLANGSPFSPSFNISDKSGFSGTGATSGSNTVSTQLGAVVTKIEPNGVLALAGRTNVNINGNVTGIEVTGYARTQDVGQNDTISFDRLTDSNVQYVGVGAVNSAHHVPWFQDVFSKYSPF